MSLKQYQKDLDKIVLPKIQYKKKRVSFQWLLLLFIIVGLIYGEFRFYQLELQQEKLIRIQEEQQAVNYLVEFLIVSNCTWGESNNRFGIVSFTCNDSRINPDLWVNGSAMTGKKITYYWVLSQGVYMLINWVIGW